MKNHKSITLEIGKYTVLMSDRSRHSDDLRFENFDSALKRGWFYDWKSKDQYFEWTVNAPQEGKYRVDAIINLISANAAEIIGPENTLVINKLQDGWDRIEIEDDLVLPAGESFIRIQLPQDGEAKFRCLHLLNRDDEEEFYQRVKAFRSDTSWLRDAQFGLMFQCGGWGYPPHGDKKPWPEMINDFDVEKFADMAGGTGARYVIWSSTWCKYLFPAPIKAIDDMMPGHTCERDLISDIADALKQRDIRLILYYHLGYSKPHNWETSDNKELFFKNFINIVTEVGARYGTKLDGLAIDDGVVIAPAPFEKMANALKKGNPNRLVSFNTWVLPRMTEFQDYHFGEGNESGNHGIGEPGTGIVAKGGQKGMQAHGMFIFDGPDWGINKPETVINPPRFNEEQLVKIAENARDKKITLSFNLLMYEDGSVSQKSLDALKTVEKTIHSK